MSGVTWATDATTAYTVTVSACLTRPADGWPCRVEGGVLLLRPNGVFSRDLSALRYVRPATRLRRWRAWMRATGNTAARVRELSGYRRWLRSEGGL